MHVFDKSLLLRFGLVICCLISPLSAASGIFIAKKSSSHPDSTAKVYEYDTYFGQGAVTKFSSQKYGTLSVTKFNLVAIVPYTNYKKGTIRPAQLNMYRLKLQQLEATARKYDNAAPYLKNEIASLQDIKANLEKGFAWHNGSWKSDSELDRLTREAVKAAKAKAALEKEAREREMREQRIAAHESELSGLNSEITELMMEKSESERAVTRSNKQIEKSEKQISDLIDEMKSAL